MEEFYFHTQEKREKQLSTPIFCNKSNAWLGGAYYFWLDEDDAHFWGHKFKNRTGKYDVYSAQLELENVLDTVFNKEEYLFWLRNIEKAAKLFLKKTYVKPTLKELNDYFYEKGMWSQFDGILFQDISNNPVHFFVKEFQYKKRIQIAVYNTGIIVNFAHHFEGVCI